jgi:hypothetical protein
VWGRGFVTDGLDAGATREQVQHHGRWNNITSIDPSYRKTLVWGRTNPSQHLATATDQPKNPSRNRL